MFALATLCVSGRDTSCDVSAVAELTDVVDVEGITRGVRVGNWEVCFVVEGRGVKGWIAAVNKKSQAAINGLIAGIVCTSGYVMRWRCKWLEASAVRDW